MITWFIVKMFCHKILGQKIKAFFKFQSLTLCFIYTNVSYHYLCFQNLKKLFFCLFFHCHRFKVINWHLLAKNGCSFLINASAYLSSYNYWHLNFNLEYIFYTFFECLCNCCIHFQCNCKRDVTVFSFNESIGIITVTRALGLTISYHATFKQNSLIWKKEEISANVFGLLIVPENPTISRKLVKWLNVEKNPVQSLKIKKCQNSCRFLNPNNLI